ncbi:MAG: hypothetical protein FJ333_09210 [Sphingomonadales bacterium]|nr:hypothetical protein [Sphingomonadales bacterium]
MRRGTAVGLDSSGSGSVTSSSEGNTSTGTKTPSHVSAAGGCATSSAKGAGRTEGPDEEGATSGTTEPATGGPS